MPSCLRRTALYGTCLLALLVCGLGCGTPPDPQDGGRIRTVVLVTIDTWRRDATGFLGGLDPSPTPFLDRLAAAGTVGTDAVSPVPLTGPSHWSILSGRWPWRDGVRTNGDPVPADTGPALAELLAAEGWRTGGFVSAAVLDRRYGFDRGFQTYDDTLDFGSGGAQDLATVDRPADETVDRAVAWLRGLGAEDRAFLWLHMFDPHFPYTPPGGPFPGPHPDYLGEVAHADSQLARLDQELAQLDRSRSRTLWVVLSDHGESLGEHGERTHGMILHGATHRIPFLIAGPGVPADRLEGQVATVDTLATVSARLGLPAPETDGIDLLERSESSDAARIDRAIPMETLEGARIHGLAPVVGLRRGAWLWEASPAEHVWNLADDPDESDDLAAERPERTRRLRATRRALGIAPFERAAPRSGETGRELRALGYLGGGAQAGHADVREFVRSGQGRFFQVLELQQAGAWGRAEALIRRFLESYPGSPHGWIEAGFVAVGRGDLATAEERFRQAFELDPSSTRALVNLANTVWQRGRPDEAATLYRRTLELDPRDYFALYNLGTLLSSRGDPAGAREVWERFLEAYPEAPRAGPLRRRLGRP